MGANAAACFYFIREGRSYDRDHRGYAVTPLKDEQVIWAFIIMAVVLVIVLVLVLAR